MRLWITRSESAAKRLQQALGGLAEDQLKLTCAALIKVEQIDPWQYSQAQWQSDQLSWHRLDHLPDSSCVVVVSVTAAQCYLASQVVQNERTHIAVGDATAAALKARGLRVEVPKTQSSEGLAQLEWPRWLHKQYLKR